MPRKSVKDIRANEILDAFEVCIARQGFNNVTLADIGKQADIQRPAIRHFVGNRDELRQALTQRYVDRARQHVSTLFEVVPMLNLTSKSAIADLLVEAVMTDEQRFLAICNLFVLAKTDTKINQLLNEWVSVYADYLIAVLGRQYKLSKPKLTEIAYSIVMTCIGLASVANIDQAHYSKLASGAIAQQLAALTSK